MPIVKPKTGKRKDVEEKANSNEPSSEVLTLNLEIRQIQGRGSLILPPLSQYLSTIQVIHLYVDFNFYKTLGKRQEVKMASLFRAFVKTLDKFTELRALDVHFLLPGKEIVWNQMRNAAYFYGLEGPMYNKWTFDFLLTGDEEGSWMPLGEELELALRKFYPQEMTRRFFKELEATM